MTRAVSFLLSDELRPLAARIAAFFQARGVEAFLTGGAVRDSLLGRPVTDIDISVRADPPELGPALAGELGGAYFPLHEARRQARIVLGEGNLYIDLLPLEGPLEDDLRGRDLTINALAVPLAAAAGGQADIIDPAGGLRDLDRRLVRAVSEANLREDPIRLLRAVRIALETGFQIEEETGRMLSRLAHTLAGAAAERQRDEFVPALSLPRAAEGVRMLDRFGLLSALLPELDVTRGVEQPNEHHWDVFNHSVETVAAMDMLLADERPGEEPWRTLWTGLWTALGWWPDARARLENEISGGVSRKALLKLAALLHDIGKPEAKSIEANGRIRFFGHSDLGAEIAGRALRRLRFPSEVVSNVRAMLKEHLRPAQMAEQGVPSDRAIYRFFRDTGDAGIDTLFLSLADHLATAGPRLNPEGWGVHLMAVSYVLQRRLLEQRPPEAPRLVTGDGLMAGLGLPPGPLIGRLLEAVGEAQAAGEVSTPEEALELARRQLDLERAGSRGTP
jgi:putative nucleotidyltransferase with HDIG domain